MKIVFDMDDILWDFVWKICRTIDIDESMITSFNVYQSSLSRLDADRFFHELMKPSYFDEITWFDGIEKISQITQTGTEIYINSNCNSEEAKERKMHALLKIPGITEKNIILNVNTENKHKPKDIEPDVDIFVDDCPANIAHSKSKLNILRTKPYNITETAKEEMKGKSILYFDTLNEIMNFVLQKIKSKRLII